MRDFCRQCDRLLEATEVHFPPKLPNMLDKYDIVLNCPEHGRQVIGKVVVVSDEVAARWPKPTR